MSLLTVRQFTLFVLFVLILGACGVGAPATVGMATNTPVPLTNEVEEAELPRFPKAELAAGEKLQVVATTNIVADVVKQVGSDRIDLYPMLPPGADPHSYQATTQDLRLLTDADVVFINGLGLEEAMATVLADFENKLVAVNVGVDTITLADEDESVHEEDASAHEEDHIHSGVDPHTWFSVPAVEIWTRNIDQVLSDLDPANADAYATASAAYSAELKTLTIELAELVDQIPETERKLVTDHDALGYLAREYGFVIVGAVIPSFSTMAEPSAQQLASLQDQIQAEGVAAIFVGTSVSQRLERQLAADLGIAVVPIYTGSLTDLGGPVPSYTAFMRYNLNTIVAALQ